MSLRKPGRETDLEIKEYLDSFSTSLCMAKWYNATIWLGSGQTTSCHHPLPHQINEQEIKWNPTAIHNTPQKKSEREMMQNSMRPAGCDYCWTLEDMDKISDRVYKSVIYEEQDVLAATTISPESDVNLKTLEIAFDRTCNFACSYCNPAFSTEWVKDIKQNGPYTNLKSDGRNHFTHEHTSAQLYKPNEFNPYVEAFFKWWDSDLGNSLQELRLTGGEPLMSSHTWKLLEWFKHNKTDMQFALNSNLGPKKELIDKLILATHDIDNFHLYTSNESMFEHAEYIRDGFEWRHWLNNIYRIIRDGNIKGLHMMCTINALCLETLPQFLDKMLYIKEQYGKDFPTVSINILRFPSFQSPLILPKEILDEYANNLNTWLTANKDNQLLHHMELNQVERLIEYLTIGKRNIETNSEVTHFDESLKNDFYYFYKQYDERRGKNFVETFPKLRDWYNKL